MAKSSNYKLKPIMLMRILERMTDEEHPLSAAQLIKKLAAEGIEAERKSIYDDIALLEHLGLDIVHESNGYYLATRAFELPELKLLVDAVQASKFITASKSRELIKKLESLASEHDAAKLRRQVTVAGRIKNENESIYINVDAIHNAINTNVKVSFKYFVWSREKERIYRKNGERYLVSPWHLTWDDEYYYLLAYDESADMIKHYRVDKMREIELVDEPRQGIEKAESLDMAKFSQKVFGMFGGDTVDVTMRFKNEFAGIVFDRFGKDVVVIPDGNDYFKVSVEVVESPQFYSWVFGLGDGVELISPENIKNGFVERAKKIISDYDLERN